MKNKWYEEVQAERLRQNAEWGGPDHDDQHTSLDWIAYITKHVGKAVMFPFNLAVYRQQMIRVAALAVAAIEWADRLGQKKPPKAPPEFTGFHQRSNYEAIRNLISAFEAIDKVDPKRVDIYSGLAHMREVLYENSEVEINAMPAMDGLINTYKGVVLRFEIDRGIRLEWPGRPPRDPLEIDRGIRLEWPGRPPRDPQEKAGDGTLHEKIEATVRDVCSGIPPKKPAQPSSPPATALYLCPEAGTCSDAKGCTHSKPHEWDAHRCNTSNQEPSSCPAMCLPAERLWFPGFGSQTQNGKDKATGGNPGVTSYVALTDSIEAVAKNIFQKTVCSSRHKASGETMGEAILRVLRENTVKVSSPLADDEGCVDAGVTRGLSRGEVVEKYCIKVYEMPDGTLSTKKGSTYKLVGYIPTFGQVPRT